MIHKIFVFGDIHGGLKNVLQVLKNSKEIRYQIYIQTKKGEINLFVYLWSNLNFNA